MRWLTRLVYSSFFWLAAIALLPAEAARAQVIYQDNFESGVTGWSDNRSEQLASVSRFMGRFTNSPNQTSRTFTVPQPSQSLVIGFDFYRFDSWDDTTQFGFDRFQVVINGTQIFSLPFAPQPPTLQGTTGNTSWVITPIGTPSNLGFNASFLDQRFRVTLTVANPPASVALTLRTAVTQAVNDESGGFDNFRVEAFPFPPNVLVTKVSALESPSDFHLPGENVIYTVEISSTGGALDLGSLRIRDLLPRDIALFSGNYSGTGSAIRFTDLSSPPSGITCCTAGNITYSDDVTTTPVYDYAPNGQFDPAITAVEIRPTGRVRQGVTAPVRLRFSFLAAIE